MGNLVLHIGLHKTGTTFLQKNVYPYIKEIDFLGNKFYHTSLAKNEQQVKLLSNEGLAGSPYKHPDFFEQFKKNILYFESIFNQPSYVICFREPSSFIQSIYKQHLHEGGDKSFEEFLSLSNKSFLSKEDFKFTKFVKFIESKIPTDRLYIYHFDDFKTNPTGIIINQLNFILEKKFENKKLIEKLVKINKRSNPSVPLKFEKTLIALNRLNKKTKKKMGFSLSINFFGKTINPRVFCQYILPKMIKSTKKRNIEEMRLFYKKDNDNLKEMLVKYN